MRAEDEDGVRHDTDDLRHELAGIAEEKPADGARHAVPAVAIAPVGEEADCERPPRAADAVNGDGADGIIETEAALERFRRPRRRADPRRRQ